mmetsp:Transcript_4149/g.8728  ORF Transcript_4149/g.8728 Transcript_4149/m.8728 type:complete len:357 (+) Transcript_4149:630-1700(+)
MRQHGSIDTISNGINIGNRCAEMIIHLDPTQLIHLNSQILQAQSIRIRPSTRRHQNHIVLLLRGIPSLGRLRSEHHTIFLHLALDNLCFELELEPLLLQCGLKLFGQFLVHGGTQTIHEFDDGDFGSEAGPDGSHFEADDSSADDGEGFGNGGNVECSGGIDDFAGGVVDGHGWKGGYFRSSGNDNILCIQVLHSPIIQLNLHPVDPTQTALPLKILHLVLLQQMFNSPSQPLHRLGLGIQHLPNIHLNLPPNLNSMILKMMNRIVEVMGRIQERLGRNAPHIEASSSESSSHFDAGRLEAHLAGFDGGDVASGAASDDDHVVLGERGGGGEEGLGGCATKEGGAAVEARGEGGGS